MKKILILTVDNINGDPRPNRLISFLSKTTNYHIDLACYYKSDLQNGKQYYLKKHKNDISKGIKYLLHLYKFNSNILINEYIDSKTLNELSSQNYDLIICCSIEVLPLAVTLKQSDTKILFDIREYFLMHFNTFLWKLLIKPRNKFIFKKYINNVDKSLTVSEGLKKLYQSKLKIETEVYMSLPAKGSNKSNNHDKYENIKIVHHGTANSERVIENMIYLVDELDKNKYSLDLYLVNVNNSYYEKLMEMVSIRNNIRILEPVKFNKINEMLSMYDIGLYFLNDNSFNHKFALPNKIFEFIQSGLCLAFSPSPDMKHIIDTYNVGITADNYDPKNLAEKISKLSIEDINKYKENSRKAAEILNVETNNRRMKEIIEELIN